MKKITAIITGNTCSHPYNIGDEVDLTNSKLVDAFTAYSGRPYYIGKASYDAFALQYPEEFEGIERNKLPEFDLVVDDVEITEVDEPAKGGMTLLSASFVDAEGTEVRIKRSPCRHYYVKYGGNNQVRVPLHYIKGVIAELTEEL